MMVNLTALGLSNTSSSPPLETSFDIGRFRVMGQVFYGALFLFGALGNGTVIWITIHQASWIINCIWFFNLALADFFFSMSHIVPLINIAVYEGWIFGTFVCKANNFIKYLNMFCSVFLLAAISMDRAACIACPIWTRNHRNTRLAWLAAFGAWFVAIVTSLPFYFYSGVKNDETNKTKCSSALEGNEKTTVALYMLRLICGFLAPFTIIIICYGIITVVLRRRETSLRSKKPFKIILVLVVTFFLCWAPYHIFFFLKLARVNGIAFSFGRPLSYFLAYFNSCVNPILYFFMGMDFHGKLTFCSIIRAIKKTLLEDNDPIMRKPNGKSKKKYSINEQAKS